MLFGAYNLDIVSFTMQKMRLHYLDSTIMYRPGARQIPGEHEHVYHVAHTKNLHVTAPRVCGQLRRRISHCDDRRALPPCELRVALRIVARRAFVTATQSYTCAGTPDLHAPWHPQPQSSHQQPMPSLAHGHDAERHPSLQPQKASGALCFLGQRFSRTPPCSCCAGLAG